MIEFEKSGLSRHFVEYVEQTSEIPAIGMHYDKNITDDDKREVDVALVEVEIALGKEDVELAVY